MKDNTGPTRRIVTAGDSGTEALFQRMRESLSELAPGETLRDYVARHEDILCEQVIAISDLTAGFDAFDIIELMRQREAPFSLTGYEESQDDGQLAVIEIVSLVLLARGSRDPITHEPDQAAPNQIIDELHRRAKAILTLWTFVTMTEGASSKHGPLTQLAAEYRSTELNIRGKQYMHIQEELNRDLFDRDGSGILMADAIGFNFAEFTRVRNVIGEIYSDKLNKLRDETGEILTDWRDNDYEDQGATVVERGKSAFRDLFFYPGRRASFTVGEVSEKTGIPVARVDAILKRFSVSFKKCDAVESVRAFLDGQSTFSDASMIVDGDEHYLTMHAPIGTDCLRQVLENALKASPSMWRRYDRHRAKITEGLATQHLASLLGTDAAYTGLRYFRPRKGVPTSALSSDAASITDLAEAVEADALFLIEDVAVCVEVKGRSVSSGARRGNVRKLATDLQVTVGEASAQARRLEELIEGNRGVWLGDRTWLDLSYIREVHSIAVCLEDMGVLAIAVDELVRSGIIADPSIPWVVSLHDLAVIADVLSRPAEFLLYLRRRTDPGVSRYFEATDELDLFMLFLKGGLYVEPNPDRVFVLYPASGKPTKADRERYREKAIPTRVHTHTDSLDAWIYFVEGASLNSVDKPEFASSRKVIDIVDFLQDGHKPGWLRFGADLLDLSSEAQQNLTEAFENAVKLTRADHEWHSVALCYAGERGFPSLYICSQPAGMSDARARERLGTYLIAKKHQLRSDRALGIMVDEAGAIAAVQYDNTPPKDDIELDELGRAIGLQPVPRTSKPPQRSSRRAARRARASKKRRRS